MNKIFKHSMMLVFSALALVLGSCTEEFEYTGATAEGEQVYFSNVLSSTVNLDITANEVKIPVNRIQRNGELTVGLTVTRAGKMTLDIPTSVSFADGDSVAYLTIGYNAEKIQLGQYEEVTLAIEDSKYTTPYGNSSYTFSIGASEWESAGRGLYRDVLFTSFYGLESMTYNVDIEQSSVTPGMYRIVSPYGPGTTFYQNVVGGGVMSWANKDNTSIVINATDPDFIYVTGDFYPGTDDGMASQGYGVMHLFSIVDELIKAGNTLDDIKANAPQYFGTLKDGMMTMPQQHVYVNFDDSFTPLGYLDTSGWAIALPGTEFTDYSSSYTYKGRFTDVAGNNYAEGTITLGADVVNAKYMVAADGDDVNEIINGIADGSIDASAITATGSVSTKLDESGRYTMVIVTFDAEGQMRGSSTTSFTFNTGGGSSAKWEAAYTGTYDQNKIPAFVTDQAGNFVGNPFGDGTYQTTLYIDAEDNTHYKIEPWLTQEGSLEFTLDEQGIISFNDTDTGIDSESGYGNILVTNANALLDNPVSGITQEGYIQLGMMYYANMNGEKGWYGGAVEIFTPEAEAGSAAKNVKLKGSVKKGMRIAVRKSGLSLKADKKKSVRGMLPVSNKSLKLKALR